MKHVRTALSRLLVGSLLVTTSAATRYHVDADAAPGGDGLSWATAFDTLDQATALLVAGDRIWLAEGTYVPVIERVPGDPRSVTFYFLPASGSTAASTARSPRSTSARACSTARS